MIATGSRYVEAALAAELARVANCGDGARNRTLFAASAALGSIVAAGALEAGHVEEALASAAVAAGLGLAEARGVVRRGIAAGLKTPRVLSDSARGIGAPARQPSTPSFARPEPASDTRPPAEELAELWNRALPATEDPEAAKWLRSRGIVAHAVEDADAARAIPPGARLPRWAASKGGDWSRTGHRLILRLWSERGAFLSVRARRIRDGEGPKDLAPSGFAVRGLFLADSLALQVLRDGPPDWWSPRRFLFVEGTPDFLARVSIQPDASEQGPAVFGLVEGSWTPALAARVPDRSEIFVRQHADATGEAHVGRIVRDLASRCSVYRIARKENP